MLIVQKYGGTSVGSIERIRNVAARCLATQRKGHQVAVVVSRDVGRDQPPAQARARRSTTIRNDREVDVIVVDRRAGDGRPRRARDPRGRRQGALASSATRCKILTDSAFTRARIVDDRRRADPRRARRRRDRGDRRASRASTSTATSRRSGAAARTRPASRSPPRSTPTSARSTPTSTASTRPIRTSARRRARSSASATRRCSSSRRSARRCCRSARSSSG